MKYIIIFILIIAVITIEELSNSKVFGKLGSEEQVDKYFATIDVDSLELNKFDYDRELFKSDSNGNYIAMLEMCLFSKWYIGGIGRIPRWSKWSKKLDNRRTELMLLEKPKEQDLRF